MAWADQEEAEFDVVQQKMSEEASGGREHLTYSSLMRGGAPSNYTPPPLKPQTGLQLFYTSGERLLGWVVKSNIMVCLHASTM